MGNTVGKEIVPAPTCDRALSAAMFAVRPKGPEKASSNLGELKDTWTATFHLDPGSRNEDTKHAAELGKPNSTTGCLAEDTWTKKDPPTKQLNDMPEPESKKTQNHEKQDIAPHISNSPPGTAGIVLYGKHGRD